MTQHSGDQTDTQVHWLAQRGALLQEKVEEIRQAYHHLETHHGQSCSKSLRKTMNSLVEVVKHVNRADKSIIEWHSKSDRAKKALNALGVDGHIQKMINRKTSEMRIKVSVVEQDFIATQQTFQERLAAAENLGERVSAFSGPTVGEAATYANELNEEFSEEHNHVQNYLYGLGEIDNEIQNEIDQATRILDKANTDRSAAEHSRDNLNTGSMLSYVATVGAFTVGSVLYPPVLLVTVPLMFAGSSMKKRARTFDTEVQHLEAQQSKWNEELHVKTAEAKELEQRISTLEGKRRKWADAKVAAENFSLEALSLRTEGQAILRDLRAAKIQLSTTHTKLRIVSERLQECGYAETRRDVAGALKAALISIQDVGGRRKIELSTETAKQIANELLYLEGQTPQVMLLLNSRSWKK